MPRKQPKSARRAEIGIINFRIPPKERAMLEQFAALHDRNVSEEIRAALDVHLTASMLAALHDREFVADLHEQDPEVDVAALRASVTRDFEDAARRALDLPAAYRLAEGVIERGIERKRAFGEAA